MKRANATLEAFFDLGIRFKFNVLHPAKGGHDQSREAGSYVNTPNTNAVTTFSK